jgi:hypothetical protein
MARLYDELRDDFASMEEEEPRDGFGFMGSFNLNRGASGVSCCDQYGEGNGVNGSVSGGNPVSGTQLSWSSRSSRTF